MSRITPDPHFDHPVAQAPEARRRARSRAETVLVVDDEQVVRVAIRNVLQRHGYTVLDASSGEDALQLLRDGAVEVDLILTDIVMPGMSGADLVRAVRVEHPGMPIIYVSGRMADPRARDAVAEASDGQAGQSEPWMLAKPLYPAMLMAAVQGALAYRAVPQITD